MSITQDTADPRHLAPLSLTLAESTGEPPAEAAPEVLDWWSRPAPANGTRGRRGLTESSSLGNAGFAQYRSGMPDDEETRASLGLGIPNHGSKGHRIVTSPIDITATTPARRHRPSTAGSATGAAPLGGSSLTPSNSNSSPASQFLAVFSPPKSHPSGDDTDGSAGSGQVVGEYTLGRVVGTGAFGEVRRAVNNNTGAVVAVKAIRKGSTPGSLSPEAGSAGDLAERESALWFGLSHDHVLPLFASFDTPYTVYLVMLYCPSGSLLTLLNDPHRPGAGGGLQQAEAGRLFSQVVSGLNYLHLEAKIVHGDLKLENILLDEAGRCYIADFGLARKIGDPLSVDPPHPPQTGEERAFGSGSGSGLVRARTWQARHSSPIASKRQQLANGKQSFHPGSLEYAAPELLCPSTSFTGSNPAAQSENCECASPAQDIWALGCILHALLTGRLPFNDSFQPRLQMKIVRGSWEMPADIGRRAEELLRGCLCVAVGDRWNIDQVGESAWVKRWRGREDSRSPGGRGRATSRGRGHAEHESSTRSTSGTRTRSRDRSHVPLSLHEEMFSSPPSLRSPRSPSRDRHRPHTRSQSRSRARPAGERTHSQESDEGGVPPLSPTGVVYPIVVGEGGRLTERSPSLGTQGPGTPRDGQFPAHPGQSLHVVGSVPGSGSRSRSRGRRLALSGLGILEEHQPTDTDGDGDVDMVDDADKEWESRGRKMGRTLPLPLAASASAAQVTVDPATATGMIQLPSDGMLVGRGAARAAKELRSARSSRSASRDRNSNEQRKKEERRSKSVGYVLRDQSRAREEGS